MDADKNRIVSLLDGAGIRYTVVEHTAVRTVAEGAGLRLPSPDAVARSLFLCDDKGRSYYLVSLPKDKRLDLKALRLKIGSRRLCLASEEKLCVMLGLPAGAVSPFGILNDCRRVVRVLIDAEFKGGLIAVPMNESTSTVWLDASALFDLIRSHGNRIEWLDL